MKLLFTEGVGASQTTTNAQDEKIPVYETKTAAETDLANLEVGQIIATKDEGNELSNPVAVVQAGNMHAVTSNAVAQSLVALRTNFGFKIGNLMIEMIRISKDGTVFSNGRADISRPYTFSAPFTVPPTVILNSQNYDDFGYSIPIGIIRTKSEITTLSLFRNTDGAYNIVVEGIAIGV